MASFVYLQLAPTGKANAHNAVSQWALTPYAAGYRAIVGSLAVASLAVAAGLGAALTAPGRVAVIVALILYAIGRTLVIWIPMDEPGTRATLPGHVHWALGVLSFGSLTYTAGTLGSVLTASHRWTGLAPVSTDLGWCLLIFAVAMVVARFWPALMRWFGGIERAFYLTAIVWFAVFAAACVTGSALPGEAGRAEFPHLGGGDGIVALATGDAA